MLSKLLTGHSHATKTSSRSYSKRNRPVTACFECIRRKQECDRELPCDKCLARGLSANCSYQAEEENAAIQPLLKKRKIASPSRQQALAHSEPAKLHDYLGYLSQGNNALSTFDDLLVRRLKPVVDASSSSKVTKLNTVWQWITMLPAPENVQGLIDTFFDEANWYFAVLDRHYFDMDYRKWLLFRQSINDDPTRELLDFAALLFQVLALSLQFLPFGSSLETALEIKKRSDRDVLSEQFSDAGEALVNLAGGRHQPTIPCVQADLLRCAWLKNDGRGADSWESLSKAIRQARDLRLHLESPIMNDTAVASAYSLASLWYDEHKRRLWATLFVWDSHMSLQLGRPCLTSSSDYAKLPPTDCDFPLDPARTVLRVPWSDKRPSSYTLSLVKYEVSQLIHQMVDAGATDPRFQDYEFVQSLHRSLLSMLAQLPPAAQIDNPDKSWDLIYPGLVKQRLQISIVVHCFLVVLHRPHAHIHVDSRENALHAAIRSLSASQQLFEKCEPHHHKIYTLVFNIVDASIFLAAIAIEHYTAPSAIRKQILTVLEESTRQLGVLKASNKAAKNGEIMLMKCIEMYRQEWIEGESVRTNVTTNDTISSANGLQVYDTDYPSISWLNSDFGNTGVTELSDDSVLNRDLFAAMTNTVLSGVAMPGRSDLLSILHAQSSVNNLAWNTGSIQP